MITDDEKVAVIPKDLSANFNTFCKQARIKLYKHRKLVGENQERELVSDVMFSVIDKLKNSTTIDRFFKMAVKDRLKLYIFKAISTNTSFYSAPYLQKKIKEANRLELFENRNYYNDFALNDESSLKDGPWIHTSSTYQKRLDDYKNKIIIEPTDDDGEKELSLINDTLIALEIRKMLELPIAPKLFGEDWKYYTQLFKEYVSTDCSYKSLSIKYNIPKSSIAFHIRRTKDIIRNELEKNNHKRIILN